MGGPLVNMLADIERRFPEWRPWLAAMGELVAELADPAWEAQVPELGAFTDGVPLALAARLRPGEVPLALLHACRRRWVDAIPRAWACGYCPVCGAWPGFAERCGVERARYLRCVRCGCAWPTRGLACAYCGNDDHDQLGSLIEERSDARWAVEVCRRCRGYLKVLTTLRPGAPEQVLLQDLQSVEFDLAAESRGYLRPALRDTG